MRRARCRTDVASILVVALLAGCAGSDAAPASSPPSTVEITAGPPETIAPTTTTGDGGQPGSTDAPTTTTTASFTNPTVSAGPCAFTPFSTATINYVDDGRLIEVTADGAGATCLATLNTPPSGAVAWSPGGDQVLLGGDRVLGNTGTRTTGYFATNQGVHWSYPTGKALVAPSVNDGSLVWRSSRNENDRKDISFLADTELAVYHPAGKDVVAAGTAADGSAGLFIASNRGANMRPIALLEHPEDHIVDAGFWTTGDRMLFVHDHGDSWEVHGLSFPDLGITDVATYDVPVGDLRIGTEPTAWAAFRVGSCDSTTHVEVTRGFDSPAIVGPLTPIADRSIRPVGWIASDQLVVEARATGCTGPADVWVLGMGGGARQVLAGVDHVSVRDAVRSFGELPNDLNTDAEY